MAVKRIQKDKSPKSKRRNFVGLELKALNEDVVMSADHDRERRPHSGVTLIPTQGFSRADHATVPRRHTILQKSHD
jgi:hypothetical protein